MMGRRFSEKSSRCNGYCSCLLTYVTNISNIEVLNLVWSH